MVKQAETGGLLAPVHRGMATPVLMTASQSEKEMRKNEEDFMEEKMVLRPYEFDEFRGVLWLSAQTGFDFGSDYGVVIDDDCFNEDAYEWDEKKLLASAEEQVREMFGESAVIEWED